MEIEIGRRQQQQQPRRRRRRRPQQQQQQRPAKNKRLIWLPCRACQCMSHPTKYHSNRRFSVCFAGPKVILPLPRSQQLGHNLSRNWTHKMFSEYATTKPLLVNVEVFVLRWKTTQCAGSFEYQILGNGRSPC